MPTNRRPLTRQPRRAPLISREMVDLFRRARAIQARGLDEKWEDQGGRRREFLTVTTDLHRALGRRPWDPCIIDDEPDDEAGQRVLAQLEATLPRLVSRH
jgi:hypothetical protein